MCARDPGRAAERYAERLRRSATTGGEGPSLREGWRESCLLYTTDAADE